MSRRELARARRGVLLEALREIEANPCDALAWAQARRAAHHLGGQLVVSAIALGGERRSWDVADLDWDNEHSMPMLLLRDEAGSHANAYLNDSMRAHVRWGRA